MLLGFLEVILKKGGAVMIDGVKISVYYDNLDWLFDEPGYNRLNPNTGELTLDGLELDGWYLKPQRNNRCIIRGSLHKWFLKNNWSSFHLNQIEEAIKLLGYRFHFDPTQAKIENLEFGFNIQVNWISIEDFIGMLLIHKKKPYQYYNSKVGKRVELGQYFLKIYNKTPICNYSSLLRTEIKILKLEKIKGSGIKYLSDLTYEPKLFFLKERLNKELLSTILVDQKTNHVKSCSDNLFLKIKNPKYWESNLTPAERKELNKNYTRICKEMGWSEITEKLTEQINLKYEFLTIENGSILDKRPISKIEDLQQVDVTDRLDDTVNDIEVSDEEFARKLTEVANKILDCSFQGIRWRSRTRR